MKKPVKISLLVFVVLLAITGFCVWKNWHDRYVWPAPVSWMQDLPPEDRSHWPAQPVAWKQEHVTVRAATPDGMKAVDVDYSINSVGSKLVRIEPGTFYMGLDEESDRRLQWSIAPRVKVTLTRSFFMGAFEVTNREFEQFDPSHVKRRPKYQRGSDGDNHPVEPVTWREAQEYCRWLSAKEGREYRLPTEAEWEYACKAGTTTRLYWGDEFWDRNKANIGGEKGNRMQWLEDGFLYTAPVGLYPPNPWGLYDMIGNAWEWCADWFEFRKAGTAVVDPKGPPQGHCRVYKGGDWSTRPRHIASCLNDGDDPADIPDVRGFRVLCEVGTN